MTSCGYPVKTSQSLAARHSLKTCCRYFIMKTDFIPEPELEFGAGARHVDVRFGLLNYGPLDLGGALAPKHIKLGFIGSAVSIDGALGWLERCRHGIAAKKSRKPNLFPRFPGFSLEGCFRSEIVIDARLHRTLP